MFPSFVLKIIFCTHKIRVSRSTVRDNCTYRNFVSLFHGELYRQGREQEELIALHDKHVLINTMKTVTLPREVLTNNSTTDDKTGDNTEIPAYCTQ